MNYYIEYENEIVMFDDDVDRLKNSLIFSPQFAVMPIKETEKEIVVIDGKFFFKEEVVDILVQKEKENKKREIIEQLAELDEKRVRAVCEPSMKDENTTWLEYYNQEVYKLREKLKNI